MGFPRQEYWNGLPFPSPRDLPNPGIQSASPKLQAVFTAEPPGKPVYFLTRILEILLHHQAGIEHMCSLRVPPLPPRLGKPPQNSVHLSGKSGFEHIQGNLGQILRVSARFSAEFFFLSRQHTLVSMDFRWSSKSKPGLGCLNNGF